MLRCVKVYLEFSLVGNVIFLTSTFPTYLRPSLLDTAPAVLTADCSPMARVLGNLCAVVVM